jgi:hypothetical protein
LKTFGNPKRCLFCRHAENSFSQWVNPSFNHLGLCTCRLKRYFVAQMEVILPAICMFVTTIMADSAGSAGGSSNHYHFGLYAENSHRLAAILNWSAQESWSSLAKQFSLWFSDFFQQ